jgi:4-diphosphocytidyl-2-C-methyl-D-erythritol kinase
LVFPRAVSRIPDRIELRAPAKVNLYLEVIGRRADGYHDLRSIVMPVSLCDRVVVERSGEGIETSMIAGAEVCREATVGTPSDGNLATRAAMELQKETGFRGGARITIEKQIPVGGGLGGGSADAAAVLDALNRLWETNLGRDQLMKVGARIGCDVPSLVHGGVVCMEGLGERVTPCFDGKVAHGGTWWLVLANPGFPVSTGDIYGRYSAGLTNANGDYNNMLLALRKDDVALAATGLFNSLQDTVFRKYPVIEMVVERLLEAGALNAIVSGSGASVFGLARDEAHARQVAAGVNTRMEQAVWTHVVNTLPGGVMVAHGPLEPIV